MAEITALIDASDGFEAGMTAGRSAAEIDLGRYQSTREQAVFLVSSARPAKEQGIDVGTSRLRATAAFANRSIPGTETCQLSPVTTQS